MIDGLDNLMNVIRLFVDNRINANSQRSEIVVPTSEYEKAALLVKKYDNLKLQQLNEKDLQERLVKKERKSKKERPIRIAKYSDKTFVLTGDTTEIRKILMSLDGNYNPYIRNPETGKMEPGWIFPSDKINEVKEKINYNE